MIRSGGNDGCSADTRVVGFDPQPQKKLGVRAGGAVVRIATLLTPGIAPKIGNMQHVTRDDVYVLAERPTGCFHTTVRRNSSNRV